MSSGNTSRLRDSPMDFAYDSPSRQRGGPSKMWLDTAGESSQHAMDIEADEPVEKDNVSRAPLSPTVAGPDVDMMAMDTNPEPYARAPPQLDASGEDELKSATSKVVTRMPRQRAATRNINPRPLRRRTRASAKADISLDEDEEEEDLTIDDADDSVVWQDENEQDNDGLALGGARSKIRSRRRSLRKRVGDTLNIQYFFNSSAEQRDQGQLYKGQQSIPLREPLAWTDPEWCLGMAQFAFNATLLIGVTYVLFNVIVTLQRDVSSKVREYELEYLAEIEACSQNFHLNRCGTSGAVPALAAACASWQRCSARNPANVGRARVAAETVAEIVNGFVDVVSWKSMLFTLLTLIIVVGATNSFLSFFRIRSRQSHTAQTIGAYAHSQQRSVGGLQDQTSAQKYGESDEYLPKRTAR